MTKEHTVYKVTEKLPKHGQLVLVKQKKGRPFICKFECWLGECNWVVAHIYTYRIEIEKTDKWIAVTNELF